MSDYIGREAVLELARSGQLIANCNFKKVCKLIEDIPSADVRPVWIPVTERLPIPREKVLVAYKKGVTIAQMDGYIRTPQKEIHYWRGMNGPKHTLASVTHWMPIPEPPKDGES